MGSGGMFAAGAVIVGTLGAPTVAPGTIWSPAGSPETPSAVVPGDAASLALKVYSSTSASAFLNVQGDVPVTRGPGYTNIGAAAPGFGNYTVQAHWDEIVGETMNTVRVRWKTSNGQKFIPPGAQVQGLAAAFLEWRIGATNPVSFQAWVTQVDLLKAILSVSSNGGSTLAAYDITDGLSNPWNGTAFGATLPLSMFANANYIQAMIMYKPVPGPASAAAIVMGAGLCAARRRRVRPGG